MLAWVFRRCDDDAEAVETPIGRLPAPDGVAETEGLDVSREDMEELLRFDPEAWAAQLPQVREHLAMFGDRLPAGAPQPARSIGGPGRLMADVRAAPRYSIVPGGPAAAQG